MRLFIIIFCSAVFQKRIVDNGSQTGHCQIKNIKMLASFGKKNATMKKMEIKYFVQTMAEIVVKNNTKI